MSQLRAPEHVLFDLKACFRDEKYARSYRIGVVTGLETEDDILRVSGGIADFGMHEELARRLDPGNDGHVQLPVKMYSKRAVIRGGYDAGVGDSPLFIVAGQVPNEYRDNPEITYEQTDRCLRMAALALGGLLLNSPRELMSYKKPNSLMFGSAILAKLEKRIGDCIFE